MNSLVLALLLADTLRPGGVVVRDEGAAQGRAAVLNCTGDGIACSVTGGVAVLAVTGAGKWRLVGTPRAGY